jgi:hypothetical protein
MHTIGSIGKNANSGHVFAYIRSPVGIWYKAYDESINVRQSNKIKYIF